MFVFFLSALVVGTGLLLLWRTRHRLRAPTFDWTGDDARDSNPEWAQAADFLLANGVALSGTNAYRNMRRAPSRAALLPFLPGKDETFVHCCFNMPARDDNWSEIFPLMRLAVDSIGREVFVKAVPHISEEWRIISFLASLNHEPHNHTIPVVKILRYNDAVFIVQARWGSRPFHPPLEPHEWVGVAYQLLEGLAFMHKHGIGHGDLHPGNIVCNYHNARSNVRKCPAYADFKNGPNFRIAFIDFGAAVRFSGADRCVAYREAIGPDDVYRSPEQDSGGEFDLFAADIYGLGQILRSEAPVEVGSTWVRTGSFLLISPCWQIPSGYDALIQQMTSPDPNLRPSASAALEWLSLANKESSSPALTNGCA
ncbi:kinase-like domain-containing protein [Mycena leptocephala]|nr:kinase-like domain-containing protein [Mycena leptocephala]